MDSSSATSIGVDEEISLQAWRIEDSQVLFALVQKNREDLEPWLEWSATIRSARDCEELIKEDRRSLLWRGCVSFAIWHQGRIVGGIRILWVRTTGELTYWVDERVRKQGIATRACRKVLEMNFQEGISTPQGLIRLHRIEVYCCVENPRSVNFARSLGFVLEAVQHEAIRVNGHFAHYQVWRLLSHEWREH